MQFEPVARQFCLIEAPLADGHHLWFSDLLLGGLRRLSPDGEIETFIPDSKHIGGLARNIDGKLIFSGPGGLHWLDPNSGKTGDLLTEIDGQSLPGVNDMCPDSKGGLYFGTLGTGGDYDQEMQPVKLCHVSANGDARVLDEGLAFANGMGLNRDGTQLYHNESTVGIYAYDVTPDGSLRNKRKFIDRHDPDGLAMDDEDGIWIAHYDSGEIARYRPDGTLDLRASLPHKNVISLCFGGPDWKDLYVTTAGQDGIAALMRGEMPVQEAGVFKARSSYAGQPVQTTSFTISA